MDDLKYPKEAGVYKLVCNHNDKIYIGKSFNIHQRLNRHKRDAEKLKNRGYFQRAIIKHGWESFNFQVLEIFENFDKSKDGSQLLEIEASYIRLYDSNNPEKGYNICEYSSDRTGLKCSDDTKAKMRKARMGYKCSDETKEKMRIANLGKRLSENTKEKMRNRIVSSETKHKIRQSNLGKTMSDESKEKLSNSRIGIKFSKEHKEKLSMGRKGKKLSDETKEKISMSRKGKKVSEETKEKIKNTMKKRFNRKEIINNDTNM
jgi:group I intron endonuclease